MSEGERIRFREEHALAGRAADALWEHPRMLLITILLGNMTINVLYFVISSVIMLRAPGSAFEQGLLAVLFLLVIVLFGEVAPKILATALRSTVAAFCAPLLLTIHRIIGPLRLVLDVGVVAPLSRLTAPSEPPDQLHDDEWRSLLDISGEEGTIDEAEHRMLREVVSMRRLRVRDVMTPRVEMIALPSNTTRATVVDVARTHRLTKIPLYGKDLDDVVGLLHLRRYLLDDEATLPTDHAVMTPMRYVPEVATLDQLLDHFRRWGTSVAIVVDEYGGTEGIVAVEDVVEELVGDIVSADDTKDEPPRLVGLGRWLVRGTMSAYDFADAFGLSTSSLKVATVGGLVTEGLGHRPHAGDVVTIEGLRLTVVEVARHRVVSAHVEMTPSGHDETEPGP
jgi:putative hemolysin